MECEGRREDGGRVEVRKGGVKRRDGKKRRKRGEKEGKERERKEGKGKGEGS